MGSSLLLCQSEFQTNVSLNVLSCYFMLILIICVIFNNQPDIIHVNYDIRIRNFTFPALPTRGKQSPATFIIRNGFLKPHLSYPIKDI